MSDFLKKLRERSQPSVQPTSSTAGVPAESTPAETASTPVPTENPVAPVSEVATTQSAPRRFAWSKPMGTQREPSTVQVDSVSAASTASTDIVERDASESKGEQPTGPAGFRAKLDAFDSLVGHLTAIDPIMHSVVKGHVKSLMLDLNASPEMRELLLDKDVHNIMVFVQSATAKADVHFESVATKRIAKEAKGKNENKASIGAALDDLLLSFGKPKPKDVNSLANLNTDAIKSKER